MKHLGGTVGRARFVTRLPGGQRLIGSSMKKKFLSLARRSTARSASSRRAWRTTWPPTSAPARNGRPSGPWASLCIFSDWDKVVRIDHGYDETKPESELSLSDVEGAAESRGGTCLSGSMEKGDWTTRLSFRCAFGHDFEASPRLVLEGGHGCPECERRSWNYHAIAKVNPFFAQVLYPLHRRDEVAREYSKVVSDLDLK
jgi:hypothetical protein